ncbi:2-polyprenyl-3-methyl-6-methoxy-1,4-benzoquinone monooxygenase [Pelagibaculum spongiae]|uniref:3-demethoxyubiquinol 3-hydroxylase n=1 Tax=Pelagibaculum spongiae TaxID=2080658 RepID=A0A2V1GXA6_9GAMM|nr:2-polyprenyl-3-methyl-6-methoxy-1,4-benzoquinone monooxygenase [Pelagibaculum spongiae]PVZ66264.1 demethoxyubiquinone hydroxylase family protein [Pelagibaculum spongiae]
MRRLSPLDHLISQLDSALLTLKTKGATTARPNPAEDETCDDLTDQEQKHIAGLMRINHTGEICAQGLYQGQALTAKLPEVRAQMEQAAVEENDHLQWCKSRIEELDSHTSILNPAFYALSFGMGALAGKAGDKWSLGFVAETEHQVLKHLDSHLSQMPSKDQKSRAILEQMKEDEAHHEEVAKQAGGADLPLPIRLGMGLISKVMTTSTYKI